MLCLTLFGCAGKSDQNPGECPALLEKLKSENDSICRVVDSLENPDTTSAAYTLSGTTFLPYSSKMIGLLNKGLEPITFEVAERNELTDRETFEKYPKFQSIQREGYTLTIEVAVIENNCHQFLGEAEIHGDTLNLVYTGYGGFCSPGRVVLRYKFDTTLEKEYQELRCVTVNGSKVVGLIPVEEK